MILSWSGKDKGKRIKKQKTSAIKTEVFYCKKLLTISQFLLFTSFIKKEGQSMNKNSQKLMNLIWGL